MGGAPWGGALTWITEFVLARLETMSDLLLPKAKNAQIRPSCRLCGQVLISQRRAVGSRLFVDYGSGKVVFWGCQHEIPRVLDCFANVSAILL